MPQRVTSDLSIDNAQEKAAYIGGAAPGDVDHTTSKSLTVQLSTNHADANCSTQDPRQNTKGVYAYKLTEHCP